MWRLFKEVFRSLNKNKVMVIGLSLLIFLTSVVFTLLSTLRTTIVTGFENYKEVSKMQDISVDLNLPTQGTTYNQGYYVNGEVLENPSAKYTPITYYIKDDDDKYKNEENILLINKNEKYVNLSKLKYEDGTELIPGSQDLYIPKEDLEILYSLYSGNKDNETVKFDLGKDEKDIDNATFTLLKHFKNTKLYQKATKNDTFIEKTNEFTLKDTDELTFVNEYTIGDLMVIKYNVGVQDPTNENILIYQLAPLFINVVDKKITAEYNEGTAWINNNEGVLIPAEEWAKAFGFTKIADNKFVFEQKDLEFSLDKFIDYPTGKFEKINETLKLKNKWTLGDFYKTNEKIKVNSPQFIEIDLDKKVKIDKNLLGNKLHEIYFDRWNYYTTFIGDGIKKWTGAFATFMNELKQKAEDSNDPNHETALAKWLELENFSCWKKIKKTVVFDYKTDKNGKFIKSETRKTEFELPVKEEDLYLWLYTDNETRKKYPKAEDSLKYFVSKDRSKKILDIDNYVVKASNDLEKQLELLNNLNVRNEKYNYIKMQAYKVTKDTIINKVKQLVGEENIGIRKTTTVDGIVTKLDENGEEVNTQNVFHFINVGDENGEVDGVKLNVGKLFNEEKSKTAILSVNEPDDSVFKKVQLPPDIAAQLVQSIGRNLFPNEGYIKPRYVFTNVYDTEEVSGIVREESSKIVLLNKYLITDENKIPSEQELNDAYKELNLGITFRGNYYKIVKLVEEDGKLVWRTAYPEGLDDKGLDKGLLVKWFIKNKLTVATKYLKTDGYGWVKRDEQLSNIFYIPLEFLSPQAELINEIFAKGKVDFLAEAIEKYLLNFELVNDKFISPEQVLYLSSVMKKVLNDNNFANAFSSGKLNQEQLPKIMFDFLYELSHHESGDVLKNIIFSIMKRVRYKIESSGKTLEEQKNFLLSQVNNLYKLIGLLEEINLNDYIKSEDLVNLSKDPKVFIDAVGQILSSINFKTMSEYAREWYKTEWKKSAESSEWYEGDAKTRVYAPTKETFKTKLSSGLLINWLFNSIDQRTLKIGLNNLINNLDLAKALDLDTPNSFLSSMIVKYAPFPPSILKPIIKKINHDGDFQTFKKGLSNIITNIDFDVLADYLNTHMTECYVKYKKPYFDYDSNTQKEIIENVKLKTIMPKDGMMAFVHGLFKNPGTNREFKLNLISMFNLSSKTIEKEIEIDGKKSIIYIPTRDENKLGFFDFASIFGANLGSTPTTLFKNYIIEKELLLAKIDIDKVLKNAKGDEKPTVLDLKISTQKTLKKYELDFNKKTLETLNKLLLFIKQTKGGINSLLNEDEKTGTDFIAEMNNYSAGDKTWKIFKDLTSSVANVRISNEYALGAQAFSLYSPWINIFTYSEYANQKEANKFIQELLHLSLDEEVVKMMSELSESENIPLFGTSKFGMPNSLLHPEIITLFDYDGLSFANNKVDEIAKRNPKFKQFIINEKDCLIELFGLIALSKKDTSSSDCPDGIYYQTIKKFFDKYLSRSEFWEVRHTVNKISQMFKLQFPVELFGISRIIINPVLRNTFPQIMFSYLTTEKQSKNNKYNGNLTNMVVNKMGNFEEIIIKDKDKIEKMFELMWSNIDTSLVPLDLDNEILLVLDGAKTNFSLDGRANPTLFGIDFLSFIENMINKIVEPKGMKDIVFNNAESYLAKVNYAYMVKNNKAIYDGEIPDNGADMESLLNSISSKYILDVNGIKFLIIGEDITIDYIYPVVDENNLQVNTENQALVFLNNSGFSRIIAAYQGNVVKKNLLVKNGSHLTNQNLQKLITEIVDSSISDANKLKRVFAYNEIDPINPERALRITTIQTIIKSVSITTIVLMAVFTLFVSVSIIFIIKRYISNKSKVLGILVAQGYKPIEIAFSLTVFAAVTAIIGGVLGYSIGNRAQLYIQNIFSSYWTLPKQAIPFDVTTMFFTVFVPFIGMSLLIIVVALVELRAKPNDLITGSADVPSGKYFHKARAKMNKKPVTKRFSFSLFYSGFWKLLVFGASALLTSAATMFGIANMKTFNKTIDDTYKNRHYKFKVDLETPTTEGGYYSTFSPDQLHNMIYTPIGDINEGSREVADYFKPGWSSIINAYDANGKPDYKDPHILSQFSVNVAVDAGVAADPWLVAYNGMPDSQKAKIDNIRDRVGYQLEWAQNLDEDGNEKTTGPLLKVNEQNGLMYCEDENGQKHSFIKYYKSPHEKQGGFKYAEWNEDSQSYEMVPFKTGDETKGHRNEYRKFIVDGYKKIYSVVQKHEKAELNKEEIINPIKNWTHRSWISDYWLIDNSDISGPWINDYFIGFGGVLINDIYDETYTYLKAERKGESYSIYGYQKPKNNDEALIVLKDKKGTNLYDNLYNYNVENNIYPLVVNEVFARKYNLRKGDKLKFTITNNTDRFRNTILQKIYANDSAKLDEINKNIEKQTTAEFEIVGINPTYINNELITTKDAADKLIGFKESGQFNGVVSNKYTPVQVTDSTGLYSISGYWSGYDGFDISTIDEGTIEKMFDEIFKPKTGVMSIQHKFSDDEIARFLDSSATAYTDEVYNNAKKSAKDHIEEFSKIYNNKLYIALGMSIGSKDIEVGFTKQIGNTIEQISVFIVAICLAISLIILVILSTIMISENERNIAIWSILGYTQKEKIKMFFMTFMPFLLGALILAVPIVILMIHGFNLFLLSSSAIVLSLTLKWWHVAVTSLLMFGIFAVTSAAVWTSISKMKPVDLLKGK